MFEVIARGLIMKDDKILLCKNKLEGHYYLPGGHVELGENSKEALIRELEEERGTLIKNIVFIGVIENIYQKERNNHYEINLIFRAEEENELEDEISREDHIAFEFFSPEKIKEIDLKPKILKDQLLKWIEDKNIFWEFKS